jgi:oxygen-independent coproporphyrinogen-3 oxidase
VTSLYLHIPFCSRKCCYCSFHSGAHPESLQIRYGQAINREIEQTAVANGQPRLDTLFIGGGTPSVLPAQVLGSILATCRKAFSWCDEAEVSIEVNPETVLGELLQNLRCHGVNRLSMGVQSLNDGELNLLGRTHTAAQGREALVRARQAGFTNINIDLMYGIPGQTVQSWRDTLLRALDMDLEHLSLYQLSVEEGTTFADLLKKGELELPDEEAILEMDEIANQESGMAGYHRYEISNYAKPGKFCRHNLVYWHNEPYVACGAAAVSYTAGNRCLRQPDPALYSDWLESGLSPLIECEHLPVEQAFRETMVMGLRLTAGVSRQRLQGRFGCGVQDIYGNRLDRLISSGLLCFDGERYFLSERGRLLANVVMADLV